jgi:hypothetical protein
MVCNLTNKPLSTSSITAMIFSDPAGEEPANLGLLNCEVFNILFGHSFAYVAHLVFLRDVWIRTQIAAVASRRATNLATHLLNLATHLPNLSHLSP